MTEPIKGLLIHRRFLHDGTPAPSSEFQPVARTFSLPAHSFAISELTRIGTRFSPQGVLEFTSVEHGIGVIELEGFDEAEGSAIVDHFRVEAMRQHLDLPNVNRQHVDQRVHWSLPHALHNPVPMIVFAASVLVFTVAMGWATSVGPMAPASGPEWTYLPLFGAIALLCVWLIVHQARKLPGWLAMRAAFRERGETMPKNLRHGE